MGVSHLYAIVTYCSFIRTFEIADEFQWPRNCETVSRDHSFGNEPCDAETNLWRPYGLIWKQTVLEEKKQASTYTYYRSIVNRCVEEEWKGCLLQSLLVVYQHKCFVCCKPWFFAIRSFGVPAATINAGNLMDHLNFKALRSGLSLKCWGFTPVYGHYLLIRDFADWKVNMF